MRTNSFENIIPATVLRWKSVYEFSAVMALGDAELAVEEFLNGFPSRDTS